MSYPQRPDFRSGAPKSAWWFSRNQQGQTEVCSSTLEQMVTRLKLFFRGIHWSFMSPTGVLMVGRHSEREPDIRVYDVEALGRLDPVRRVPVGNVMAMLGIPRARGVDLYWEGSLTEAPQGVPASFTIVDPATRRLAGLNEVLLELAIPAAQREELRAMVRHYQSLAQAAFATSRRAATDALVEIRNAGLINRLVSEVGEHYGAFYNIHVDAIERIARANRLPSADRLAVALRAYEAAELANAYNTLDGQLNGVRTALQDALTARIPAIQTRLFRQTRFMRFARTLLWPGPTISGDYSNFDVEVNGAWDLTFQAALCAMFRGFFRGPVSMHGIGLGQQFEAIGNGLSPARQYALAQWLAALPPNIGAIYMQLQGDWLARRVSLTSVHVACWVFSSFNFMIDVAIRNPNETIIPSWLPGIMDISVRRDAILPEWATVYRWGAGDGSSLPLDCTRVNLPASQLPAPGSSAMPSDVFRQIGMSEDDELVPERASLVSDAIQSVSNAVHAYTGPEVRSRLPKMAVAAGLAGAGMWWWTRRRRR